MHSPDEVYDALNVLAFSGVLIIAGFWVLGLGAEAAQRWFGSEEMARESSNEYAADGSLLNGFDYDLQVWVRDGRILRCGHPEAMKCACNGRRYAGASIVERRMRDGLSPEQVRA